MATSEWKTIQRKAISLHKPYVSQADRIPIEIINNCHIVWLGTHSKDTIPTFACDLLKQIIFIDTAVDCIEHITSLITSSRHIVLIISDEYATERKAIGHMLNLNEIRMIYIILDNSQQEIVDWPFNDTRIVLILNDTFTVLKQFLFEEVEKSAYVDKQDDLKGVKMLVSVDKSHQSDRIKQKSSPNIRKTTPKQVKESTPTCEGFVTITGITHVFA